MSIDAISPSWQHLLFKFFGILTSIIASLAWLATVAALFGLWAEDDFIRYGYDDGDVVFISNVGARYKAAFIIGTVLTGIFFVLTLIFTKLCFDMENKQQFKRTILDSINHTRAHYIFTGLFIVFTFLSAMFSIIYRLSYNQVNLAINLRVFFVSLAIPLVITFVVMGTIQKPDNQTQLQSVAASLEWSIAILFILYLTSFALDLLLSNNATLNICKIFF
ncbi:unnamed protein product [Rotaria sp. Silwood1]|nr:unnamed protein product [Rotaria sp. Silwood1]CAF1221238.1 unnamed protein product [Rotaria sp. Silwood1]